MEKRDDYLVMGAPLLAEDEIEVVVKTFRSGWIGKGPKVAQFETQFKAYIGNQYTIALNSGRDFR